MIDGSAGEERVVVATPEFDELFGFIGCGEQALAVADIDEFIVAAVKNEQGHLDPRRFAECGLLAANEPAHGKERKHSLTDIGD